VAEMSPATQVKLLRVLQEGEFERLGSSQTTRIDFRLVAATNRDPEKAVKEGRLREDLYYRLNVVHVAIPPLRERLGDVPLLANFFLRRYAAKNDKPVSAICARAMDALGHYGWPGNVRELENVLERAVVLSRDEVVDLDDLPAHLTGQAAVPSDRTVEGRGIYLPVGTSLQAAEIALMKETLIATGGDKNLAAKLLGVSTRTIYRNLGSPEKGGDGDGGGGEPEPEP
jgi:two-component system, NtrC family, response regulator HydG